MVEEPVSDSVSLNGVAETLMLPFWAMHCSTQVPGSLKVACTTHLLSRGRIDDPAAVEVVERLEYDFKSWLGHARSMMPMAEVRATRFDEQDVLVQGVLPPGPAGLYRPVTGRLSTSLDDSPAGSAVSG